MVVTARTGPLEAGRDIGLSRGRRITRSCDFSEAFRQGRCFRGRLISMWLMSTPGADWRLGVVTGRKIGNAVFRVRARRLMREAYRLNRFRFKGSFDVVLSAKSAIGAAKRQDVEKDLLALAARAGILSNSD